MGVKDLWKILEPAGRPISPEALQGLVLSVDVSIWLNQAIKGSRDRHGNETPNAHLMVLFNRICKLLYYQIKPVFVFDGPSPLLKKKTLESRKRRRQEATKAADGLIEKRSRKLLEAHAIQTITGKSIDLPPSSHLQQTLDMFQLPDSTPQGVTQGEEEENLPSVPVNEETDNTFSTHSNPLFQSFRNDLDLIDVNSDSFMALPPEMQHDLILEKKESEKFVSSDPRTLPQKATDFSNYQLMKVMKRSNLSRKLEDVRKTLNLNQSASLGIPEGKQLQVETNRIMSTEERRYILIRGSDLGYNSQREDESEQASDLSQSPDAAALIADSDEHTETQSNRSSPSKQHSIDQLPIIELSDTNQTPDVDTQSTVDTNQTPDVDKQSTVDDSQTPDVDKQSTVDDSQTPDVEFSDHQEIVDLTQIPDLNQPHVNRSHSTSVSLNKFKSEQSRDDADHTTESTASASHETVLVKERMSAVIIEGKDDISSDSETEFEDVGVPTTADTERTPSQVVLVEDDAIIQLPSSSDMMQPAEQIHVAQNTVDAEEMKETIEEAQELMSLPPDEAGRVLNTELNQLKQKVNQAERRAAGVTSIIANEAKELLQLFGLPYVESPSEAEAQCASLQLLELTQGTITDDSDVFLFGGTKVYRHVFSASHSVESYSMQDIHSLLGLNRDRLILLAYLLGSDYTDGLEGIGCVSSVEIIQHFDGDGLEPLKKMHQCHIDSQTQQSSAKVKETTLQKRLRKLSFPTGFPDETIREAYLHPSVDLSKEPFEWGRADLDLLREYTLAKFGWNKSETDKTLLPVLKRASSVPKPSTLSNYFLPSQPVVPPTNPGLMHKSKRLRNAITRLTGQQTKESSPKKTPLKRGRQQSNKRRKRSAIIIDESTSIADKTSPSSDLSSKRGSDRQKVDSSESSSSSSDCND